MKFGLNESTNKILDLIVPEKYLLSLYFKKYLLSPVVNIGWDKEKRKTRQKLLCLYFSCDINSYTAQALKDVHLKVSPKEGFKCIFLVYTF